MTAFGLIVNGLFTRQVMAMVAVVTIPVYGIIRYFPDINQVRGTLLDQFVAMCRYLGILFLIASVAAFYAVSLYYQFPYVVGVQPFVGVKLSLILPLLIIGLYFYCRPNRLRSVQYVFNRLMISPVTTRSLISIGLCFILVAVYLVRSGNVMKVPIIEPVSYTHLTLPTICSV